jgi:nuclear GTP-binding protein
MKEPTVGKKVRGENFYRSAKKVKQLNILKEGRAVRDRDGRFVSQKFANRTADPVVRIQPDRRFFGFFFLLRKH